MPLSPSQLTNADFNRGKPAPNTAAVPFERRLDPAQQAAAPSMDQHEVRRILRYKEAWNFYFGKQWKFERDDGEPLVTMNYFRKLIDKSVSFLFGQGVTYTVPDALELITLPLIEKVWKDNKEESLYFDIGTTGAVTGDVFILVTHENPTPVQMRTNPFAKGRIRLLLLGSEQVFPDWDPLDLTKMLSVKIDTMVKNPLVSQSPLTPPSGTAASASPGYSRYVQEITPDVIREIRNGAVVKEEKNLLGEIPLIHIKNLPVPSEYYGLPDSQDLVDPQRELNEKMTDVSDIVNYHAGPITVITGAKAKQLDRGPKKIWSGLPEKATVQNLTYDGDLGASQAYIGLIKKGLFELSDVPENALGGEQAISNTSGVALSMLYRPLIEKTEKKMTTYGPGLERVNYFILRTAQVTGQLELKYDLCESCGGRIVEHTVEIPGSNDGTGQTIKRVRKDCFEIDRQSLDFLDPMEMKVRFLQKYPEGSEVREEEFWKVFLQYRGLEKSFWQPDEKPEPEDPDNLPLPKDELGNEKEPTAPTDPEGNVIPPKSDEEKEHEKRTTLIGVITGGTIKVPPEPLEVQTRLYSMNADGSGFTISDGPKRQLVPTGCSVNEYLNPYKTEANFPPPLPKDEKLEVDLLQTMMNAGLIGKKWARRQLARLKNDLTAIEKEIEEDGESNVPAPGEEKNPEFKDKEQTEKEQQKRWGPKE